MSKKSPSSNPHRLHVQRSYETTGQAAAVHAALTPEVDTIPGERSTTTVERSDRRVTIEITAADLPALRAAKQTWFTLLQAAEATTNR